MTPPRPTARPFWLHSSAMVLFVLSIINTSTNTTSVLYSDILIAIGLALTGIGWLVAKRERDAARRHADQLKQLESKKK